ncbi:MAG: DUF1631 domain-containing protein [Betaproteobacteria bacterium]|nr:DUF1631 domain-containing protein [Betaproteobacteria bacterium]
MSGPYRNVVPIDASQRARVALSPHESAGLVSECRGLALERLAGALGTALERVEDELFALAEKTKDREAQNDFLDARSQARARRPFIEAAFGKHFVLQFNQRVKGVPDPVDTAPHELMLVDEAELERVLALRDLAARLAGACEGELRALSQRLAFVLHRPELSDEANPAGPHAVAVALAEGCGQIEAGAGARLALLRALEGPFAHALAQVYGDLNARLVERGILPELRHALRRSAEAPAPRRAAAPDEPKDAYAALAQLLSANAAAAGPADGSFVGLAAATQGFVHALTRLQQPAGGPGAAPTVNVIRDLKSAPQGAALAPADSLTIDIVAMLFDFVFEDRQIPVEVKAAIGRLQIPMVKVALLDRGFFSARAHPARKLLNRLAEASIGLDTAQPRGRETLARIEKAVGRVLDEFDTDVTLFSTLAGEFDVFLAEDAQAEEALVQRAATFVESRERDEIARLSAETQVDARLAEFTHVAEPVRVMLEDAWARALGRVGVTDGEGSPAWNRLLGAVDELLWSLEPKSSPEDRRRLVNGLPSLLATLHHGLELAEVEPETCEAFFGALVDCHADAVKAGLKGLAVAKPKGRPQDAVEPATPAAPTLERARVRSGGVEVEEIRLRAPRGAPPVRNVFTRTGIWTNVQRFSWVEFAQGEERKPVRARLTWISPAKGVYLFTNPQGDAAVSITPEALAEQMRRGEARLIDDAPLVDRAVDSMLASLKERAA